MKRGDARATSRTGSTPAERRRASTSAASRASCRTRGCDSVEVVNEDGQLETRSMIYTEYFVKRHAADDRVPARTSRGRSSSDWPASSAGHDARPCRADATGLPTPPPTSTSGSTRRSRPAASRCTPRSTEPSDAEEEARLLVAGLRRRRQEADEETTKEEERKKEPRCRAEEGAMSAYGPGERYPACPFATSPAIGISWNSLLRAVERGTLPPSLIFAGPDGVGKRLARRRARAVAAIANACSATDGRRAVALDACGACASCRRIARGVHADVLSIEPGDTGAIKIDQVRDAIERTGVPAVRGAPPRRHHRRGGRGDARSAERAAEDARGAAVRRRCSCW